MMLIVFFSERIIKKGAFEFLIYLLNVSQGKFLCLLIYYLKVV